MYLLYLLFTLCVNTLGEPCFTPFEQLGECVPIRLCSSLLDLFANPKYGITYLQKYVCSKTEFDLHVCCVQQQENPKECGVANNLVINDGVVSLREFPWLVKIMTVNNTVVETQDRGEKVACTGVLINHLYVLYSAECHMSIITKGPNFFIRTETYVDNDGCDETFYSPKCNNFEVYDIDLFVLHPYYDDQSKINNIAILKLNRRVNFSEFLQPICLPTPNETAHVGQILHTVGWKRTYNVNDISIKRSQSSILISNLDCNNRLFPNVSNNIPSSYEMCTHTENNMGDEDAVGFPLMSLQDNRWYLQGFESQGKNTKVYTRVQSYIQWIQDLMGLERCITPYNQTGECMEFSDCPKLMDAFANPSSPNVKLLRKFICRYGDSSFTYTHTDSKVCCVLNSEFIIPSETIEQNSNYEVSNFDHCGFQYSNISKHKNLDDFPWLAVIVNATLLKQRQSVCGGTLITDRYVLTSGRCISWFSSDHTILVRLNDYTHHNIDDYKVEEIIIHPFYTDGTFMNDIALIRLSRKVKFTDHVQPICVPRNNRDLANYGETLYTISNKYQERSDKRNLVQTMVISHEECKEKLKLLGFVNPITMYQICTEDFKNSTDVNCRGDEGGPLFYSKKSRWFIEGISSTFGCGINQPQTFLKVFEYLKWIHLNIRE